MKLKKPQFKIKNPARLLRLLLSAIIIALFALTPFAAAKISSHNTEKPLGYSGIIEIWHVDVFSGGIGSRKQLLNSKAREFEKAHKGVLISVIGQTVESCNANFSKGIVPDMLSFGIGIDVDVSKLIKLPDTVMPKGGNALGATYALPWAINAYYLIRGGKSMSFVNIDTLTVGTTDFSNPLAALKLSKIDVKNLTVLSADKAYQAFVHGKTDFLLGTLKDVHRLTNRQSNFEIMPLYGFTDLLQYVCVFDKGEKINACSLSFLKSITEFTPLEIAYKIGMFGADGKNAFEADKLKVTGDLKDYATFSAFLGSAGAKSLLNAAETGYFTDEFANKLKTALL